MNSKIEESNLTETNELERDEVRKAEIAYAEEQSRQAKTPLGRRLWELRAKIIASGLPLLDWDGLEREIAERRGRYRGEG